MKYENELALIIAYYISKFDEIAYENLRFGTKTETHEKIGNILSVKGSTVQNMRDEFDPIHDNPRAGWYQKPLSKSRVKVINSFGNLEENELREIVLEILNNQVLKSQDDLRELVKSLSTNENKKEKADYYFRGITGKRAEEHFLHYYKENNLPLQGLLVDKREYGCGYDFEIQNNGSVVAFIEIKGIADSRSGISFTAKEWEVAKAHKDKYYLILIKNTNNKPEVQIIQNPYQKLFPDKKISTVVQINWCVPASQLKLDKSF